MGRVLVRVSVCVALLLALLPGPLAGGVAADTVSATDLLRLHNEFRYAIGAPTIPADPRVALAAQRHADYSAANGTGGHYEQAGLPYYSGYGPRERVAAAGWNATFVSEVAASYREGGVYALRELWHAPYHRLGMMHPNAIATGWGHSHLSGRSVTVGNLVYDFGSRPVDFVRSPAHAQSEIPTTWSGNESPSPLPAGATRPVGYPIMVVYSGGQNVQMRAAELVAPGGVKVPFYYVTQLYEYDYQVIIPQRPLAAGTTYHVRMDLTVNGRYVTNEWDFTTEGTTSAAPAPAPAQPPFSSGFLDQTAWPTLRPGATTSVTLRFKNTGTATWQKGVAGRQANLGINGDSRAFADLGMAVNWLSPDRVATTVESSVPPGGVGTFTFSVRAPAAIGEYRLPLRPVIDGVQWLEDQGVFLVVKSDHGFHAKWVSQSAYPTLRVGQLSAPLTISFANTGAATWTRGSFGEQVNLGINGDDRTWSALGVGWPTPDRVAVQNEATVPPGALGTFTFQVRAPSTPGVYAIHLRPVADGVTWLEDQGVFLYITVNP